MLGFQSGCRDRVRGRELPVRLDPLARGKLLLHTNASPFLKDGRFSMPHHLAVREHFLAALLESPEDAILSVSLDGAIDTWSQGAERIYGYTAQEITGQPVSRLVPLHEWPGLNSIFSEAAGSTGSGCSEATERLHKDGSRICLRVKRVFIRDEQGNVTGFLEGARVLHSCTDPLGETPLRLIIQQMPGLYWTTDQDLRITSHWGKDLASAKILPDALVGRGVAEFLACIDRNTTPLVEHYEALRGFPSQFEYRWRNRVLDIRLEPLCTPSGAISGCLGSAMDITDRKKNEEQAHFQARHDALTGLANYRAFMDRLEEEVRRAERSHRTFTVLLLDLDGLKRINDLHGHLAGNRALQRLAAVMNEHCRSTDLAVRYGGDEFALVMIDSDKGMAEQVAYRIENGLQSDQGKPPVSVSIGFAIYPEDGRTAAELIEAADRQLYQYKRTEHRRTAPPRHKPSTPKEPLFETKERTPPAAP
jgi:diguanylate cyclase (GGDEF)-like protein/PAS domain S-box-containing protein